MQFVWSRRFGTIQFGAVSLATGILLLLLAGGSWLKEHHWSGNAVHASGIVTELEARRDADGSINYVPHVRFNVTSGRTVQFTGKTGTNPANWKAGERVPVVYAPGNPLDAAIATRWNIYNVSIVLGMLGVIFFDLGFALVWMAKRRAKRRGMSPEGQRAAEIAARNTATRAANFWGGGRRE